MEKYTRRMFLWNLMSGSAVVAIGSLMTQSGYAVEVLDYQFLVMKLYAKTPMEEAYLKDVVDKRDQGVIPQKIVYAAYKYAMKYDKAKRLDYFAICLSNLCQKAGIKVSFKKHRK